MKIEHKIVDTEKGVMRITTLDERWYEMLGEYYPSLTWIGSYYPKGIGYMKWVADKGWDEAERIKNEAGDKGTAVHHAVETLLNNGKFTIDEKVRDKEGVERELTPEEYYGVVTFSQWYQEVGRPKIIAVERSLISKIYGFGCTIDYLFSFEKDNVFQEEPFNLLVDMKTGKYLHPNYDVQMTGQISACRENGLKVDRMGILQVGYTMNKTKQYKFTEFSEEPQFITSAKFFWQNENKDAKPHQKDYPLVITL